MRYRGIGIARVSKWVSFIDQARFGIYDSRVSRALRHIEINGHRVFPIVPDRSRDRTWSREDLLSSKSYDGKVLAVAYATYLQLLQMLGERLYLPTAQVEMGLFVIGRTMPDPSEVRKPFDKELYAPRPGRPEF